MDIDYIRDDNTYETHDEAANAMSEQYVLDVSNGYVTDFEVLEAYQNNDIGTAMNLAYEKLAKEGWINIDFCDKCQCYCLDTYDHMC